MSVCSCGSDRIVRVGGKTSDMSDASVTSLSLKHDGYVLRGLGIGGGDYLNFSFCARCGLLQRFKPLTDEQLQHIFEPE